MLTIQEIKNAKPTDKQRKLFDRDGVYLVVTPAGGKLWRGKCRAAVGEFEDKIRSFPEVTECYVMMGRSDFLLRIVTRDIESYETFFRDHLSQLPGVQDITSAMALSEVKYTTELPLQA